MFCRDSYDLLERVGQRLPVRQSGDQRTVQLRGFPAVQTGPWVQVSRLGNPLFNEVLVLLGKKDAWNASVRRSTPSTRTESSIPSSAAC